MPCPKGISLTPERVAPPPRVQGPAGPKGVVLLSRVRRFWFLRVKRSPGCLHRPGTFYPPVPSQGRR
eukprot:13411774-Heterocapsa_arctica.AAC.1